MAVLDRQQKSRTSTKICEWGTSRALRIPKRMCDDVGVSIGDVVDMTVGADDRGSFITVRPASQHRSFGNAPYVAIDDLFRTYEGDYTPTEFDWGEDVGEEVVR